MMPRTDDEVVLILKSIYNSEFGGKARQRYLISWADLREIYGFKKLFLSRFQQLAEAAYRRRAYLFDLGEGENGHLVAVIPVATVDRWRRVPKKIIDQYRLSPDEDGNEGEDDDE
jgi:hypothetical protein